MTKVRKAQIFTGKDNILAAHLFFIPDSQEPQKLTSKHLDIIFPGLPQSPCFHQLESLVTEDRSILYVHYYGSWYSGGIFTPSNTGETVRDLLTLCKTRLAKDEYTNQIIIIEPENITLVGNSFGGHFVYQNESQEITHNVVLISPLLAVSPTNLTLDSSKSVLAQVSRDLESFQKTLRFVYRGIEDHVWNSFVNHEVSTKLHKKPPVKIILGEMDTLITPSYISDSLKDLCGPDISTYPCGHNFYELYRKYIESSSRK